MDWKPLLQNKWLIVLGLVGIGCLLFGSLFKGGAGSSVTTMTGVQAAASSDAGSGSSQQATSSDPAQSYENQYDKRLTEMLKQMAGVHDVSVMVTLDSTENLTLANNTKQTTQSQSTGNSTTSRTEATTEDVFTQRTGAGDNVPFVTKRSVPQVRGVLVLVNAEDFAVAKSEIVDAITNVLDVPAYKISVEPEKSKP